LYGITSDGTPRATLHCLGTGAPCKRCLCHSEIIKDIKMSELILNYIRDPMALYFQAVSYCSGEVFVYVNDECGCIA
jgi:hypothetical protein